MIVQNLSILHANFFEVLLRVLLFFFFFDVKALEQLHLFSDGLKCNSGYCIKCGENQLLSEGLC